MSLTFTLANERDTQLFGALLAKSLERNEFSVLLLKGTLGAGKTTLVRAIVQALPGGKAAEVSSPSFTLMNVYTTSPPIKHFDLYRLDPFIYDENLDEALDEVDNAVFIEWAERIPEHLLPREYLQCTIISVDTTCREVILEAQGDQGQKALLSVSQGYTRPHLK